MIDWTDEITEPLFSSLASDGCGWAALVGARWEWRIGVPMTVVFIAAGTAVYVLLFRGWGRMWRGQFELADVHAVPSFWVWGAPLWRAWVRSWFVASSGCLLAVLRLVGMITDAAVAYVLACLMLTAGWLFLSLSVVMFNRPRFVIPPHLRSEPGLVAEIAAGLHRRHG
jgi:hypothetical protein